MDNKDFSNLGFLQNPATDLTGQSEPQQAEQNAGSAGSNQQAVFSGRLTAPLSHPQSGPTHPKLRRPQPIYGEHIAPQQPTRPQPLTNFRISSNSAFEPFIATPNTFANPILATVHATSPITATQQLNVGTTGSLPLAGVDPFVALANYQPLSFEEPSVKELSVKETCSEESKAVPRPGTDQNLDSGLNLLADVVLADANKAPHGASATTEASLQPPQKKRRKNSLPQDWVIYTDSKERPFQCAFPNCKKSFKNTTHFKSHMFTHTRISNYRCTYPECGDNTYFAHKSDLDRHTRTKHSDEKPFVCDICGHKTKLKDNLKQHLFTHTRISNYRCTYPECGDNTYFVHRSNLDRHMRIKHSDEKPFVCDICGHKTKRKDHLKVHLLNRHGIKM